MSVDKKKKEKKMLSLFYSQFMWYPLDKGAAEEFVEGIEGIRRSFERGDPTGAGTAIIVEKLKRLGIDLGIETKQNGNNLVISRGQKPSAEIILQGILTDLSSNSRRQIWDLLHRIGVIFSEEQGAGEEEKTREEIIDQFHESITQFYEIMGEEQQKLKAERTSVETFPTMMGNLRRFLAILRIEEKTEDTAVAA